MKNPEVTVVIPTHNRKAIESNPMSSRIQLIEGSSLASEVVAQAHSLAAQAGRVMVYLDSNDTHEHVRAELEAYGALATPGSYRGVFDTLVEDLPEAMFADRSWGPGNNPHKTVREYLRSHPEFEIDPSCENKLLITVAAGGFLRKKMPREAA